MEHLQPVLITAGGVLTALASVMGAVALILARRNERTAATKEETQQAFDLQQKSMENVERDNERLRHRQDEMHETINRVLGQLAEVTTHHRRCEESLDEMHTRLRAAETRIAELGG